MQDKNISLYDADVTIKLHNVAGNGRSENDLRDEVQKLIHAGLPPWVRDEVTFDRVTIRNVRHQQPGEQSHAGATAG